MIDPSTLALLKGKKALVTGIANDQSIAWGCAKAFQAFGADLAITYRNEKTKRYVDPLAEQMGAAIYMPLDVQEPDEMEAVFLAVEKKWGKIASSYTPSRLHRKMICMGASSIAPRKASCSPWSCPAGPSSVWRSWPNRS